MCVKFNIHLCYVDFFRFTFPTFHLEEFYQIYAQKILSASVEWYLILAVEKMEHLVPGIYQYPQFFQDGI